MKNETPAMFPFFKKKPTLLMSQLNLKVFLVGTSIKIIETLEEPM